MTVYVQTGGGEGPLGNSLLVREAVPNTLPVVTHTPPPRTSTRRAWVHDIIHPKRVTTDVPAEKIAGDPIEQLERSRNARGPTSPYFAPRSPAKRGDMEGIGDAMPMRRESEVARARRRQALAGERREAISSKGGTVTLGTTGNGLDYMQSPRIKPALPNGRMELVAPTQPLALTDVTYLDTTIPAGTRLALQVESAASEGSRFLTSTLAATDEIGSSDDVSPVAIHRADTSTGEKPADAAGRFFFMLAALGVAYLVLRR